MKIALDLGQKLGYCVFNDLSIVECDAINLPSGATKTQSLLGRRYSKIKELIAKWPEIDTVYYELTDWHRSGWPTESFSARNMREKQNRVVQRALGRLEAIVESASVELGKTAIPVKVHDAKRVLTGNGNASKDRVRQEIVSLFPKLTSQTSQDAIDAASIMIWAVDQTNSMWRFDLSRKEALDF